MCAAGKHSRMSREEFEGGCLCGAIRIRAVGFPQTVVYCHCGDCRRWSGAPVSALAGYSDEQVQMLKERPEVYESSPGIRRSFCGSCGTALAYEDEKLPGEIYFLVGSFDEPEQFEPLRHSWFSQKLSWLRLEDDAPRHQESSRPR